MHISITGRLGSGKSTIAKILKRKYGYRIYSTGAIHREIALRHNVSTLEMNSMMENDLSYDYAIDNEVTRISVEKCSETIIFDSRMAWKFAKDSFKVFVTVDPVTAAERVIEDNRGKEEVYSDIEDARIKLIERSKLENRRFIDIYNVDYFDYNNYNLILDSTYVTADELAEIAYEKFQNYCESSSETTILMSPESLYPLNPIIEFDLTNQEIRKEYSDNSVTIIENEFYHYITKGQQRVLSAVLGKDKLINVNLDKEKSSFFYSNKEELLSKTHEIGLKGLKDYEKIYMFSYKSYPSSYN